LYTYICSCGHEQEEIVDYERRDIEHIECEECGEAMRRGIDAPQLGSTPYQMKAVLGDGSHVTGHFGKSAKRKKG
jgi:hypothetical protein